MLPVLTSISALLSSVLLLWLANGLLGSLLGLKLAQVSATPFSAALVMAAYYLGLVTGFRMAVSIIKRVGHIRAFAAFCSVNIATTIILSMTDIPFAWILLRFGMGLSMMGTYMVIESWINERATPNVRGQVFAIYLVVSYGALGGGQFLLGFDDGTGHQLMMVTALLFSLCLLPVALTRSMVPAPLEQVTLNVRQLYDAAPHAIYGCLAAGLVTGAFYGLGPTYAFEQTGDNNYVGLFMGVTVFGGLLLQWPLGWLSDHFKRRLIIQMLGISLAVTSSALVFLSLPMLMYLGLAIAALWGGFAFTIYPVAVAYANDRIAPEESVPAAGVLLVAYSMGAALGPLMASAVMFVTAASGLFLFSAAVGGILALLEIHRRGAIRVSVADQGDYIPVPRSSAVIAQLDPRTEDEEAKMEAVVTDPMASLILDSESVEGITSVASPLENVEPLEPESDESEPNKENDER